MESTHIILQACREIGARISIKMLQKERDIIRRSFESVSQDYDDPQLTESEKELICWMHDLRNDWDHVGRLLLVISNGLGIGNPDWITIKALQVKRRPTSLPDQDQ